MLWVVIMILAPVDAVGVTTSVAHTTAAATTTTAAPTNTAVSASIFSRILGKVTELWSGLSDEDVPPLQGALAGQAIRWMTSYGNGLAQCKSVNGTNAEPKAEVTTTITMAMPLDVSNMTNVTKKAGRIVFTSDRSF